MGSLLDIAKAVAQGAADQEKDWHSCALCRHLGRFGNCGEPVLAGLRARFEIAFPAPRYGADCPAFERRNQKLTR
jgi:hypothetical protein